MKLRRQSKDSEKQEDAPGKNQSLEVSKVEVSDNIAKFFVAKGFGKRQWIVVREIPVLEIEHIEKFGNELSVTWNGTTQSFFTKEKTDLFNKLVDQVNVMFEDQQKSKEKNEKEERAALRRKDLLGTINTSVGIIDQSFNVLIGLQEKHINWERLESYSNNFGENTGFTAQSMPPLNLSFTKIMSAIKTQSPKETADEAFSILKVAYGYFNGLNVDDEFKEKHPNFLDAKTEILAYFMLNDLLLGKVVGDKENKEEISQLENVLQNLAAETNFKVNIDELKSIISKIDVDSKQESTIAHSREIFKQQLKQQLKPKDESSTTTQVPPKVEVSTEPVPEIKVSTEPTPKVEISTEPVPKVEVLAESTIQTEAVVEPVPKVEESTEPISKIEVTAEPAEPILKVEKKQKSIQVSKVEVSDNIVKFFVAKGLFKKQWILVLEIPVREIEHIEKFGNELWVTWWGTKYTFVAKEKTELFSKLVDQINEILRGTAAEPVAPPFSVEPVAKTEVVNEPVPEDEVDTEPVSKESVVEPALPSTEDNQPAPETPS